MVRLFIRLWFFFWFFWFFFVFFCFFLDWKNDDINNKNLKEKFLFCCAFLFLFVFICFYLFLFVFICFYLFFSSRKECPGMRFCISFF